MNKLIKLVSRIGCCKSTQFLTKSCFNPNICFTNNHNLGLASIEHFSVQPINLTLYENVIPVYIGYKGSDKYLSYSRDKFQPVITNRVYQNGDDYKYVTVDNNGKILTIN